MTVIFFRFNGDSIRIKQYLKVDYCAKDSSFRFSCGELELTYMSVMEWLW